MDIEESTDILKNIIADEVIGTYCIEIQKEGINCSENCKDEDCYLIQAIETVLNELDKKDKIIKELLLLQKPSRKRKNRTMNYIKTNKANKFGVNGVCQDMRALKRTGEIKYRAYITLFGKQYTLGTHDTLESAIQARKNGEEKVKNILKNLKYKESED